MKYPQTDCLVKDAHKDGDGRTRFTAIANSGRSDRDGEKINVDGWIIPSPLPPLLFGHNPSTPFNVMGRLEEVQKTTEGLMVTASINDTASPTHMTVAALVRSGDLSGVSVGFEPFEWTNADGEKGTRERGGDYPGIAAGRTYTSQELMELSFAPVQSDLGAFVTGVKALGLELGIGEAPGQRELDLNGLDPIEQQCVQMFGKVIPSVLWKLRLGLIPTGVPGYKAGAVLSSKNMSRVREIEKLAVELRESAEQAAEE